MNGIAVNELDATLGRRIFECSPIGMVLVSGDMHILRANRAFGAFLGYTPRALVGKTVQELTHPDDLALTTRVLGKVWSSGFVALRNTKRYRHKSGKVVWGEVYVRLVPGTRSQGRCHIAQVIDITERKQGEEDLRRSEQAYKALTDNAPDLVVRFDRKLRHLYVSPAIETITGRPPRSFIGKTNKELGMPKDLECRWSRALREVFRTTCTKAIEFAMETPQGRRCYQSRIAPEFEPDGSVQRLVCFTRDITEQRGLEEALRESHADLEDKVKERTSRLRAVAGELTQIEQRERRRIAVDLHDGLGQVLALCKMKLEGVQAAVASPTRQQLQPVVRLIEEAIRDTRSLTFQLSPPVLHEIGLSAATEWLAEQLSQQHGMTIRVTCKASFEPKGLTERVVLFQAVRELLLNAIKHARAATIAVDIRVKRDHLEITVKDNGVGFDPGALQGLGRKGLGLFNVQERLQLIGGVMSIRSHPGEGAAITLTAPVKADAGQEESLSRRSRLLRLRDRPVASCPAGSPDISNAREEREP